MQYIRTGWRRLYLIFGMCDESFSINYTTPVPEGVNEGEFLSAVTLLNHSYWVAGSTLGGIFGSAIKFNTAGLEFVLTSMFVVIFLEQWLKLEDRTSAYVGFGVSLACLLAFGPDKFIIPTMIGILGVLTLLRRPIERREKA